MLLSKEVAQKLANPKPKILKKVPELDCDVRIRMLTGPERLEYLDRDWAESTGGGIHAMADLVIMSVIDENGNQVFTDDDHDLVVSLNLRGLTFVANAASEFNGLSLEEAEGNS